MSKRSVIKFFPRALLVNTCLRAIKVEKTLSFEELVELVPPLEQISASS